MKQKSPVLRWSSVMMQSGKPPIIPIADEQGHIIGNLKFFDLNDFSRFAHTMFGTVSALEDRADELAMRTPRKRKPRKSR